MLRIEECDRSEIVSEYSHVNRIKTSYCIATYHELVQFMSFLKDDFDRWWYKFENFSCIRLSIRLYTRNNIRVLTASFSSEKWTTSRWLVLISRQIPRIVMYEAIRHDRTYRTYWWITMIVETSYTFTTTTLRYTSTWLISQSSSRNWRWLLIPAITRFRHQELNVTSFPVHFDFRARSCTSYLNFFTRKSVSRELRDRS